MDLENIIPYLNERLIYKLKGIFNDAVNIREKNLLVLIYQMNIVFNNGDNNFKNYVIEEINKCIEN